MVDVVCTPPEINLTKIAIDIACIKQAVIGDSENGQIGLCQRVKDLEDGIPKTVGIFSTIGIFVGSALTWLFNFINKG